MCPTCGQLGAILESKVSGTRRKRRYGCTNKHRWTTWIENAQRVQGRVRPENRLLSESQVEEILLSSLSTKKIAALMSISHGTVSKIRRNEAYADLFPEIDRAALPSKILNGRGASIAKIECRLCTQCIQWENRCLLGIPDQLCVGPRFANECSAFFEGPR